MSWARYSRCGPQTIVVGDGLDAAGFGDGDIAGLVPQVYADD